MVKCSSCGREVASDPYAVRFSCPKCTKEIVVRCINCRANAIKYSCECGFVGP